MTKKDPGKTQVTSGQLDRHWQRCLSSAPHKQCHADGAQNTINELQLLRTKKASCCSHLLLAALTKWKWVQGPQKSWKGRQTESKATSLREHIVTCKQEMSDTGT